jgi:hypothetical protein
MTGVFFELGDVLGLAHPFHRWMTAARGRQTGAARRQGPASDYSLRYYIRR